MWEQIKTSIMSSPLFCSFYQKPKILQANPIMCSINAELIDQLVGLITLAVRWRTRASNACDASDTIM